MPPVASSLGFHVAPGPPTRVLVVGAGPFPLEVGGDPALGPGVSVANAPPTATPLSDAHARLFVGLSVALAAAVCAYDVVYLLALV